MSLPEAGGASARATAGGIVGLLRASLRSRANDSQRPTILDGLKRSASAAGLFAVVLALGAYLSLRIAMLQLGPPPLASVAHLLPEAKVQPQPINPVTFEKPSGRQTAALNPDQVDPRYLAMLFAFEDRRFFSHPGIDPVGLVRAARDLVQNGRIVTGGSTLTMQVARLLDNQYKRTASVKFRQIIRALQLEEQLSKKEILALYLGLAPFGGKLRGVRAASMQFFGKEPQHLTIAEAALLVALPQAPEARRLDRHAEAARRARNFVISKVAAAGIVTPSEAALAKLEPVIATSTQMPPKQMIKLPATSVAGLFAGLTLGINFVAPPATANPMEPAPSSHFLTSDQPLAMSIRRQLMHTPPPGTLDDDRKGLWMFYAGRSDPMWVTKTGWTPAAEAVIAEIKRADDWGLQASAFSIPKLEAPAPGAPPLTEKQMATAEIGLSLAILKYARYARGGRITDPATQLSSYLDRKPPVRRPWLVMTEIAQTSVPDAYLRKLNPQHPQFERLRQLYLAKRNGGGDAPVMEIPKGSKLSPGASDEDIALVRERLGVPVSEQGANFYDDVLAEKVKAFQTKRDISPANGVINSKTRRALNQRQDVSINKLLANMEEWRWMPDDLGETYVWVNVPEFMVRVVKDGKVIHQERVITGQTEMQTPIFSENLKTIFFHPRWIVPESIKVNEIGPAIARGGRRDMVVMRNGKVVKPGRVNWSRADIRDYDIYQPSGPGNALGLMKFTFPNKHMVYMHDTQNKGLFNDTQRTFSHGCVRVRNPQRLAEVLLNIDKGWTPEQVTDLVKVKGEPAENGIELDKHIPVHITYFTAEVDDDGDVVTQEDVYKHEKRINLALGGKWKEIDKGRDHLAPVELARRLNDDDDSGVRRSSRRASAGGGGRRVASRSYSRSSGRRSGGGGGGGYATRVSSRGSSANDVFRSSFGN